MQSISETPSKIFSNRMSKAGLVSADAQRVTGQTCSSINRTMLVEYGAFTTDDRVTASDEKSKLGVAALNHACW